MTRDLKELLTGTAGLARLGREYADGVQTGKIDGDDFGIALSGRGKIMANKTRSGVVDLTVSDGTDNVTLSGNDIRAAFAIFYGALAAEFDEPIDTGEPKKVTEADDLSKCLVLLREARGLLGGEGETPEQKSWFERCGAVLSVYGVPA